MKQTSRIGWAVFGALFVGMLLPAPVRAGEALYDTAVPPYRLEAEDFVNSPKVAVAEKEAGGGHIARNAGRVILLNLPFPQTARPLTVYLRVMPGSANDRFTLGTYFNQKPKTHKTLQTAAPNSTRQWQWIRFKPVSAKQVGPEMRIDGVPDKAAGQPTAIDSIVVSTQSDLDDAALNAAHPLLPTAPLARIGRTDQPPQIDGRGDDPAWGQTVAIRDFLHFGFLSPAAEGTTARLTYDTKNLYVLMECQESLLRAADMRQSEIKARVKERDGKVLNDDSCLIFLQPRANGPVYEFSVNTIGTLLDASLQRDNLWATRDVKWNSSATVAVKRGDGVWTLEMAIPLSDLGVSQIKAGDRWGAALVRVAQGRKETSSWNPTSIKGAHAPDALGTLDFDQPPVGLAPAAPLKELDPGPNALQVALNPPAPKGIDLIARIRPADKTPAITRSEFPAPSSKPLKFSFDVSATGAVQAQWGALEAGSMRPIYLSPVVHASVQATDVALKITTSGPYEVIVNDQVVSRGPKADAQTLKLPIRQGANVVAVRADAGSARLALQSPRLERFDNLWRAKGADTSNATAAKLDDRAWPLVKAGPDGALGQSGKPTVFRRTILSGKTLIWPVPQPALYIAGNSTQQVNFKVEGLVGKKLEHWTTWLAVPKGLKVAGVTGYYGDTNADQPKFSSAPAGQTTTDGQSLSLYKLTADKPVRHIVHPVMSLMQVMLQIDDPADAREGVSWTLHYWSAADDGTVIEAPRSFEARALPPLAGKQPKKLLFQLWGSYFGARMDSEAMRLATLATLKAAGFNQITGGDTWTAENGPKYGVGNQLNVTFQAWSINLAPFLKEHAEARLIDHNGKPSNQLMCTTLLLGDRWPVASAILADLAKSRGPALVHYDYEFSPFTGPHSCYCDRCLAAFRQRAKLPADLKLTPRLIEDHHRDAWEDFMAWRAAQLLALMKQTVHQAVPGVPFSCYSLMQSPRTRSVYGIDWRYIGQLKSVDFAEVGSGRPLEDMEATVKALDGIPIMYGVWIRPYSPSDMMPAMVVTKAELLRRTLDATAGVLVYDRNPMDGRSWRGVAETTRLVADYEPLFLRHDLQEIPGQDPAKVQLLKGKDVSLVCIMNESTKPATFNLQLPADLGGGKEYYSGQSIAPGAQLHPTVAPGDAVVYVLHP